jgi:allantoicase
VIRGVVVDTAFFKGNYPSVLARGRGRAARRARGARLSERHGWPTARAQASAGRHREPFAIDVPWRFTHLRLHIDPDGGVARLRVHGEVVPDRSTSPGRRARRGVPQVDLRALEHGGAGDRGAATCSSAGGIT